MIYNQNKSISSGQDFTYFDAVAPRSPDNTIAISIQPHGGNITDCTVEKSIGNDGWTTVISGIDFTSGSLPYLMRSSDPAPNEVQDGETGTADVMVGPSYRVRVGVKVDEECDVSCTVFSTSLLPGERYQDVPPVLEVLISTQRSNSTAT